MINGIHESILKYYLKISEMRLALISILFNSISEVK